MAGIEIVPLTANRRDAEPLANAARVDLETLYDLLRKKDPFTEKQELEIQRALDEITPERSMERIAYNPGQYFAAEIDGQQSAFLRANTFFLADQAPYERRITGEVMKLANHVGWLSRINNLQGIFALFGNPEAQYQAEGVDALIKHALYLAKGRETVIGLVDGDPLKATLEDNYFVPTRKRMQTAPGAPHLHQELWSHHGIH